MSKKRILIIDDEAVYCKLVKKNLELIGDFEVEIAIGGKQGIALAKQLKPDLVLLDIMMPGIDGFDVLERLKDDMNTISIPVVMLTAKEDEASRTKVSQLYGEEYIAKTIRPPDLKAKIEKVLKRKGIE